MPSEPADFLPHVGYVLFPRRPADLTDPRLCPACFWALSGPVCPNCGLDTAHPAAAGIAELGTEAVDVLQRRLELIGRIR
ncbi:MAG TPA: hypothetical protein VN200_05370, partial [Rhodoglobus sp.]|nr:hypothetical protein [Rhodoglobus sp.]